MRRGCAGQGVGERGPDLVADAGGDGKFEVPARVVAAGSAAQGEGVGGEPLVLGVVVDGVEFHDAPVGRRPRPRPPGSDPAASRVVGRVGLRTSARSRASCPPCTESSRVCRRPAGGPADGAPAQAVIGRCTLIDWSSPMATQTANIDDPPYDTNGSGSPATGMMPSVMPMFSKAWKANQAMIPAATIVPYSSVVSRAIRQARHRTTPSSSEDQPGAEEAEFLARDGEDEVGLLLGHELAGGLGALEEPGAGESAGADRDARLVGVVADARRVECRVGEGGEAVDLVLVEHAELPDQRRRRRRPAPSRPKIQRLDAPEASSTPSTMTTMTMTEPRSGISMTITIGRSARPSALATVRWSGCTWSPASTRAASIIAMPRMIVIFTNSEGCREKPPPITIHACAPLMVAPSGVSTARTSTHREAVEDRHRAAQGAVAEPDRADHQGEADAGVQGVPEQEVVRVAVGELGRGRGSPSRPAASR